MCRLCSQRDGDQRLELISAMKQIKHIPESKLLSLASAWTTTGREGQHHDDLVKVGRGPLRSLRGTRPQCWAPPFVRPVKPASLGPLCLQPSGDSHPEHQLPSVLAMVVQGLPTSPPGSLRALCPAEPGLQPLSCVLPTCLRPWVPGGPAGALPRAGTSGRLCPEPLSRPCVTWALESVSAPWGQGLVLRRPAGGGPQPPGDSAKGRPGRSPCPPPAVL